MTTRTTKREDLALLRLIAQRITGPKCGSAAEAVRHLTAMQAQDKTGVVTSVALRVEGGTTDDVLTAFDAGEVVKSWPMRGTLHLVAAEDLGWLRGLGAGRAFAGTAGRRVELGLDEAVVDRVAELTRDALRGGGRLLREDLTKKWAERGVDVTGQRGPHLLGAMAQLGVVCFGPTAAGVQQLVLVDEWIPDAKDWGHEESLGELALRYFRGHGPASLKDLVRWVGITVRDARTGLALARGELSVVEVDGVEYFLDPATPDLLREHRSEARGVVLLPGFDEYMLGYGDRTAALPAEHSDKIVPGGNGMFKGTVIDAGQVVGTWRWDGRGAKRAVLATPLTSFSPAVSAAVPRVAAALR